MLVHPARKQSAAETAQVMARKRSIVIVTPFYAYMLCARHTREAREKIAASKKGVKRAAFTPEHRQKMADARRGKRHSEETKAKIGKANRTRIWTEESRQKASSSKRGRRWICHPTEGSRLAPSCEVPDYLANGWVLGRSTE